MIRTTIIALTLAASATAAQAAQDCASIPDSLLRLRCYDAGAAKAPATTPAPAPAPASAKPLDFLAYPAAPYSGPVRMPNFAGASRSYANFRTRIREGMRGGANFAGHLALIQFGCGTGCSVVLVGDVAKGTVTDFPIAGEDVQGLDLTYRRDSALVKARWQEGDRCVAAAYAWTGRRFERLDKRDIGAAERCWQAD